ncbi:MAG: uracil-DNA glycosylase [Bacilli bacterium]|jgi:uracil-DNA glycosylase|nr:uracil-DNA glycosylase [Bacilli bacterium]MCX4253782.1 uracil-DNA glycosylase [Bacilli bacterium]
MIGNDWDQKLEIIWESEGFKKFYKVVEQEYATKIIFPPKDNIFEALKLTSYENTRVVIVGQDPYHGEGEAHGLSFSVQKGVKVPPSLQNIYKELYDDLGIPPKSDGDLTNWAKSGVLLLNAVLTVVKDTPASHRKLGWERLTDYIIKQLNEKDEPVVFILWGNFAKEKASLITNPKHLILSSPHPSPFAARYGFFGSKPFSKTNDFLRSKGLKEIDWKL